MAPSRISMLENLGFQWSVRVRALVATAVDTSGSCQLMEDVLVHQERMFRTAVGCQNAL